MKLTTKQTELALSLAYGIRQNIIVPNVSWGWLNHEADLILIRKSGYAIEIEIKISKADLYKDFEKRHGHKSDKIKGLYYCIPSSLVDYAHDIPNDAGILAVYHNPIRPNRWDLLTGIVGEVKINGEPYVIAILRKAVERKNVRPLSIDEISKVCRLGVMRYWNIRYKNEL